MLNKGIEDNNGKENRSNRDAQIEEKETNILFQAQLNGFKVNISYFTV